MPFGRRKRAECQGLPRNGAARFQLGIGRPRKQLRADYRFFPPGLPLLMPGAGVKGDAAAVGLVLTDFGFRFSRLPR